MGNSVSSAFRWGNVPLKVGATTKLSRAGRNEEQKIEYAVSEMRGKRQTMEDKHIHITSIPVNEGSALDDHSLFAVFDGHGGEFSSCFLEQHFVEVLASRPEMKEYAELPATGPMGRTDVNGIQMLRQALHETFKQLDAALTVAQKERNYEIQQGKITPPQPVDESDDEIRQPPPSKNIFNPASPDFVGERSGSTAVTVLITPTHILCANCGDSRAFLRRSGKTLPLSFDHKPSSIIEKARVTKAGGTVKSKRVDGDLAVSRAFGDFIYKGDCERPYNEQKITVEPDILLYPRDIQNDEFIVLACDGIWDVATSNQCSEFVQSLLADGETNFAAICEEAIDICFERGSRDNMTMMLVALPGIRADRSGAAVIQNALWGYRTARKAKKIQETTNNVTCSTVSTLQRGIGIEQDVLCTSP